MITLLRKILEFLSKTKWLITLIVALVLINILMTRNLPLEFSKITQKESKNCILDLKFSYSQQTVNDCLESYGAEGRKKYFIFSLLDLIYPLVYSLLLGALLYKLFFYSKYNPYLFALFAGLFDYVENGFLIYFTHSFPNINKLEVMISSLATSLKWSFIIISFISLFFGVLKLIRDRN